MRVGVEKVIELVELSGVEFMANFLVNIDNGTFDDAITLIELTKSRVYNKFAVTLSEEIKITIDKYVKISFKKVPLLDKIILDHYSDPLF